MTTKLRNLLGVRALPPLLAFLFLSAIYLYAFPQANVFYAVVVLLHALVGLLVSIYLLVFLFRLLREGSWMATLGWVLVPASSVLRSLLIKIVALRGALNSL